MTRLQRFRAFTARMNSTADPSAALEQGMYADRPGVPVWSELQRRLEVDPSSSHLVLGGIGSGKTTEVLKATAALQSSLSSVGDHVEYCDVSKFHHLEAPASSGILFSLTGDRLRQRLEAQQGELGEAVEAAAEALQRFAHGFSYWTNPFDDLHADSYKEQVQGKLVPPPEANLPRDLGKHIADLRTVLATHPGTGKHAIFCFDSLDRLPAPETFVTLVRDDLRALRAAEVGVVVVGPIRYVAGHNRALAELFDHTHFQLSIDPGGKPGLDFLCDVLRRRAGEEGLLLEPVLRPLARASGGVLRDLITLAKRAAEEAYTTGRDTIELGDVTRASNALGRSLAIGLDDEQLTALGKVHDTEKFVVRGDRELSLLETRRVLMYEGSHGGGRWAVHPALAQVLDMIPGVPS